MEKDLRFERTESVIVREQRGVKTLEEIEDFEHLRSLALDKVKESERLFGDFCCCIITMVGFCACIKDLFFLCSGVLGWEAKDDVDIRGDCETFVVGG